MNERMAQLRLAPMPKKAGAAGFAGLLAVLALLIVLPAVVVRANLTNPETKRLVADLDRQLFGRETSMEELSDPGVTKAKLSRIMDDIGTNGSVPETAVRQAEELTESASGGQGVLWLATLLLMAGFFLIVSLRVTGRPLGLLVNERNLMSLSRFQTALWTILLLSAYYTAASLRIYGMPNAEGALDIGIDWHLWALMGISFTSMVATPLIHAAKQDKTVAPDEADKLRPSDVEGSDGLLYANPSFADASWTDMFEGEEVKNSRYVDIAKLQMFFFTVISAVSYGALLLQMFGSRTPGELTDFPAVSEGLLALLGISHAGYLTSKTIDRTKSAD